MIGMKVRESGLRMLYDHSAVAVEEIPDVRDEWVRRVRIGAGDYQALVFCRRCLAPQYGYFAWSFWSHKVLRWFTPHLGILLLLSVLWMVALSDSALRAFGQINLLGVLLVLLAAVGGRLARDSAGVPARLLRLVSHFVSMQLALVFGFVRFCRGGMRGHWTRTPRRDSSG